MTPTTIISPEGKQAAGRIAAARAKKNAGSTITPPVPAGPTPTTPIAPPAPTAVNTVALSDLTSGGSKVAEAPPVQMQDFNTFISQYQANTTKEQAAIDANRAQIREQNLKLAEKGARGDELDAEYGLPGMYDESAKLRTMIADITGSFGQAIVNEEGVARPMEFITGRQDFLNRQKASQIEALSAAQAAMDGNIALAESRIDRAIEREFGDIEAKLEAEKWELTENKDDMEKKDAKAYQNRVDALAERGRQLQDDKDRKKEILNYATEAASNGAPADVVAKITKATTAEAALELAGSYVGLVDRLQAYASIAAANRSNQPTGNEYGTLNGKPQNVSQATANGYADRIAQANITLSALGNNFTGKFAYGAMLPNILQGADRQSYEQAKNNFATAVLRRESGAAISPTEFSKLEETYFPTAGDQADVVFQKEVLRNTVINSFYREANVQRPVLAGDIIADDSGVQYKVDIDGETLIPLE